VVAERMIRTLKQKCETISTQYELEKKKFNLYDVLPKVLDEYNNQSIHSTTGFTPTEASKKKNEKLIQQIYYEQHDNYYPHNGTNFAVGDYVRLYRWKTTFEKGFKANYTKEIFVISSVYKTKPITYSLKDLEGEPIEGKVYSWEMVKTKL
jgi:hypothetical protein